MVQADSDDRKVIRALLDSEPGWATTMQLAWEIGGEDLDARRRVRAVLSTLARDGQLQRQWVRHRSTLLETVYLERDRLVAALGGDR